MCMVIIKKHILVFGEGLAQGLDDSTITAEAKHPVNKTRQGKIFVLSQYICIIMEATVSYLLMP